MDYYHIPKETQDAKCPEMLVGSRCDNSKFLSTKRWMELSGRL